MAAKESGEQFILKAHRKHGVKFDYSRVVYKNSQTKVVIVCPKHGPFLQTPASHLFKTYGCRECGYDNRKGTGRDNPKYNKDDFVRRGREIHGNKYDYSKAEYVKGNLPVVIICPKHGEFRQVPSEHYTYGCQLCGRESTKNKLRSDKDSFISKARETHGIKYDYSKVVYDNSHTEVLIICPKHGEFRQKPIVHYFAGHGCPKCGLDDLAFHFKKDQNVFIQEAVEIHGTKYDYSKVLYKNSHSQVVIGCPIHGDFLQKPYKHLVHGCWKCGGTALSNKEEFVEKARKIHGQEYDYSLVRYKNNKTKVTIICHKHGKFRQKPNCHLSGNGCNGCKKSHGEKIIAEYLKNRSISTIREYSFESCKHKGRLRNDFTVAPDGKNIKVIEHHGKQHYYPCSFGSKKPLADVRNLRDCVERDSRKKAWCESTGKQLLVIPFWDIERTEEILDEFFAGREPKISEPPPIVMEYAPMREKILEKLKSRQQ